MKIDINGNGGEFTVGGVDEKQIDFIYDKLKNSEETGDGRKPVDHLCSLEQLRLSGNRNFDGSGRHHYRWL